MKTSAFAHESRSHTITVNGQGIVNVVPDVLKFSIVVEKRGIDGKSLHEDVVNDIEDVITILEKAKIDRKRLKTTAVNFYPWYERDRQTNVQKGFVFSSTISVTMKDFTVYPDVIQKVLNAGVNRVESFRYEISDKQVAYTEALSKALDDASSRAMVLAKKANITLGDIINIDERSDYQPVSEPSLRSRAVFSESTQYLPGSNSVSASVSVTFSIE